MKKLEQDDFNLWDHYVLNHPEGTIFHTTNWLSRINPEIEVYVQMKEEVIEGGIALIKTTKNKCKGYHIPPYTPYFGPLFGNTEREKQFFSLNTYYKFCADLLKSIPKSGHYDFKVSNSFHNILPFHWKGFQTSVLATYTIQKSLEDYLKQLNKNKYRELKKLLAEEKAGNIKVIEDQRLPEIVSLLETTAKRKNFKSNASIVKQLFEKPDSSFMKTFLIESKDLGVISAGLFLFDNKRVYNLLNVSKDIDHPVYKTINLLTLYKGISFALDSNRIFDFEGSMIKGVESFYRLMGGTHTPLYRLQKSKFYYFLLRTAQSFLHQKSKF